MAFLNPWIRAQMRFQLPDGENATINWALNPQSGFNSLSTLFMNGLETRAATFWQAIDQLYYSSTKYTGVAATLIGVNGTTIETAEKSVTPAGGTSTAANLPSEVAVVASLISTNQTRRGKGRLYLPAPSASQVTAEGRLDTAAQTTLAGSVSDLLDLFVADGVNYTASVASRTGQFLSPVTKVKVGNVFDVQRRRRDKHNEVYVESIVQ